MKEERAMPLVTCSNTKLKGTTRGIQLIDRQMTRRSWRIMNGPSQTKAQFELCNKAKSSDYTIVSKACISNVFTYIVC